MKNGKPGETMKSVRGLRIAMVLMYLVGITTPFTLELASKQTTAMVIATVGWACFVIQPLLYPVLALRSGTITSDSSISQRTKEPWRYWIGLVTFEVFLLFWAFLATLVYHAYIMPRG